MALYTPSGNPTNASRGLASVIRSEFALIAAGINAIAAEVLTLTNKTINFGSNTITGTKAQFDAACSDGNFLYSGGDLGTPSAGVLTNCTGLPISTGVAGLAGGVAAFLGAPSSANLSSALTDETGGGGFAKVVFSNGPTISGATLTGSVNMTGATVSGAASMTAGVVGAESGGDMVVLANNGGNWSVLATGATSDIDLHLTPQGVGRVIVDTDNIQIASPVVPLNAAAEGSPGEFAWDSSYLYVCVAANTWKRAALSTW